MEILFLNTMNAKVDGIQEFLQGRTKTTDVFCFQEVYQHGRNVLEKIFSNYNLIYFEKEGGKFAHFGMAVFVRNDIQIVYKEDLLNDKTGVGSCIYVELEIGEQIVNLGNVHGIPVPGDKLDNDLRIEQTKEILRYFSNIRGAKIIGGDFNLLPNTRSVCMFEENGYRNLIADFNVDTTRNNLAWRHYAEKQLYADYIFTRGIKVKSLHVPKNEISDHLPMILEVEI